MSFSLTGIAQAIIDAFSWLLSMLYIPLGWALDALIYILKAVVWLILDGFFTVVLAFVSALDFSSVVFQWTSAYTFIPAQAVYIMQAIAFPQFVTLIASAYVIRFLLNILPSWATRV